MNHVLGWCSHIRTHIVHVPSAIEPSQSIDLGIGGCVSGEHGEERVARNGRERGQALFHPAPTSNQRVHVWQSTSFMQALEDLIYKAVHEKVGNHRAIRMGGRAPRLPCVSNAQSSGVLERGHIDHGGEEHGHNHTTTYQNPAPPLHVRWSGNTLPC